MDMIDEAYEGLETGKPLNYLCSIKYSGKFKGYNANVRIWRNTLTFGLSKNWRQVSRDIKIGLLQELFCRILKIRKSTQSMDLYSIFLKKVHLAVPKSKIDPGLEDSFERVNEKYFFGMIEKPNLVWGAKSFRKFGSYDYGSDTISISISLKPHQALLDYVMYHEMLHKKHKFSRKNGRTHHHTSDFRKSEKRFDNADHMERMLARLAAKRKVLSIFGL